MDTLDSRALRFNDCYAQRFMKAGKYVYSVLPVLGYCVTAERPFSIDVGESANDGMKQHSIVVGFKDGRFTVDQETLSIAAGDLVLWNCPESKAVPFTVNGEREFFSSDRLVNESGYSHAFGSADQYEWIDAYGSGASGLIRVEQVDCRTATDFQRWQKELSRGTLVTISGSRAEPREVEIVTGQTVFFIVTKGPGISITDRRLLEGNGGIRRAGEDRAMA